MITLILSFLFLFVVVVVFPFTDFEHLSILESLLRASYCSPMFSSSPKSLLKRKELKTVAEN